MAIKQEAKILRPSDGIYIFVYLIFSLLVGFTLVAQLQGHSIFLFLWVLPIYPLMLFVLSPSLYRKVTYDERQNFLQFSSILSRRKIPLDKIAAYKFVHATRGRSGGSDYIYLLGKSSEILIKYNLGSINTSDAKRYFKEILGEPRDF